MVDMSEPYLGDVELPKLYISVPYLGEFFGSNLIIYGKVAVFKLLHFVIGETDKSMYNLSELNPYNFVSKGVSMLCLNVCNDNIYVRFVDMPNKRAFDELLVSFKQEFCHTAWDWNQAAWRLSLTDAPRLTWFAYRYFGYNALKYEA